jgi:hypothetical protein
MSLTIQDPTTKKGDSYLEGEFDKTFFRRADLEIGCFGYKRFEPQNSVIFDEAMADKIKEKIGGWHPAGYEAALKKTYQVVKIDEKLCRQTLKVIYVDPITGKSSIYDSVFLQLQDQLRFPPAVDLPITTKDPAQSTDQSYRHPLN